MKKVEALEVQGLCREFHSGLHLTSDEVEVLVEDLQEIAENNHLFTTGEELDLFTYSRDDRLYHRWSAVEWVLGIDTDPQVLSSEQVDALKERGVEVYYYG